MNEKTTIEVGKVPIITKFIYTLGVLPTSYLMSMTYQEQVTWLCNYIQTTLIPQINEDVEAIQELQSLYELLRTYVNDYFDNLDVQEEINNKLDDLISDGTIGSILDGFISNIENQINQLENDKMDKNASINMSNLGQDVKEAITGGSTAVVGVQSISKYNVTDNAIRKEHIDFINDENYIVNNPNFYNSFIYNKTSGAIQTNSNYFSSEEIPCSLNDQFHSVSWGNMWWSLLDSEKEWLESINENHPTITNSNAAYIVLNASIGNLGNLKIMKNRQNYYVTQTLKTLNYPVANNPSNTDLIKIPTNLLVGNDIQKEHCAFLNHVTNNLYDYRNFMFDKMFRTTAGDVVDATAQNFGCTNLIDLGVYIPDETIFHEYANVSGYTYLFDENKVFIGSNLVGVNSHNFVIPNEYSNAKYYARAINQDHYKDYYLIKEDSYVNEYHLDNDIQVQTSSILAGKKIGFLGDSITNGYAITKPFRDIIQENTGCIQYNYGINRSRISTYGDVYPMCTRYVDMDDTLDYVLVFGGVNDCGHTPIGTEDSTDTDTFYGALNVLMTGLLTKYTTKKIGFVTPIKCTPHTTSEQNEIRNAIVNRCNYYGIPYYDLYNMSGLNPNIPIINQTLFRQLDGVGDGVHPNDQGTLTYANKIQSFLETL